MEERRRCTTVRQLELLLEFMENHQDLALGRVRSKEGRAISAQLWNQCAEILNSEGPARLGKEWAKVWTNLKCAVRTKLVSINVSHRGTGGGPNNDPRLTPIEMRVGAILGTDVGPIPNVQPDQFSNTNSETVGLDNNNLGIEAVSHSQTSGFNANEADLRGMVHTSPMQITPTSVSPSLRGQSPNLGRQSPMPTSSRVRTQQRRQRRVEHSSIPPPVHLQRQSRSALDESRRMVLEIEKLRAEAALVQAQAAEKNAESLKLIAASIDKFSAKFCQ